jgi:hypothetical protein
MYAGRFEVNLSADAWRVKQTDSEGGKGYDAILRVRISGRCVSGCCNEAEKRRQNDDIY